MSSELWKQSNYIVDDIYTSGRIVEYDLKSANINTLRSLDLVSPSYYEYVSKLPKANREKEIGLLIKENNELYKKISNGIADARRQLFEANDIKDEEVVRIANDAVYINRSYDLKDIQFNNYFIFRQKSLSFSMINFDPNLIIFCQWIMPNYDLNLDVKGIKEDKLILHQPYMLSFIGNIVFNLERVGYKQTIDLYSDTFEKFIQRQLDIGFYREFNSISCYNIHGMYLSELVSDIPLSNININCNLLIMRKIWSMLLSMYKTY